MSNQAPQLESFAEFSAKNGFESPEQASEAYYDALAIHRLALAAFYGIDEDDLHSMRLGSLVTIEGPLTSLPGAEPDIHTIDSELAEQTVANFKARSQKAQSALTSLGGADE